MKDESHYSGWRRYACASLAFLECLLFSGLIYGWAPLVYIFKHEGVYADLCEGSEKKCTVLLPYNSSTTNSTSYVDVTTLLCSNCTAREVVPTEVNTNHGCKAQDDRFALAFTIGSTVYCASSAVFGHINLKFGTRITRIIAMTIFIGGSLMLAFTNKDIPWLMFPGLCCLGMGGLPVLVTNVQVSNLFENGASTFVGILSGAYDCSSFVIQVAKISFENGLGLKPFLIGLACCHCLVGVNTFLFLPKGFITKSALRKDVSLSVEISSSQVLEKASVTVKENSRKDGPLHVTSKPSLKQCLLSPLYIVHVVWLCILQLRFFYFLGTLNPFLHRITKDRELLVSHFTNVLSYSMMGGILTTTFAGVVYDWQKRIFKDKKTETARRLFPTVIPLSLASGLSFLMSVFLLLPYVDVLYLSYATMTLEPHLWQSCKYPSEYFGLLYGVMIVSGGLTSSLQFPLFSWAQAYKGGYFHVDVFLIILILLSFGHPITQFWKSRRSEREHHDQLPSRKETEKFLS